MYRVIKAFDERFDGRHHYEVGDAWPREGFSPPSGRAEALLSGKKGSLNKTGIVYLETVEQVHDSPSKSELDAMTKARLKEVGLSYGLDVDGLTKAETVKAIMEVL